MSKRNDVLKLIAMMTMLIDHIGYMFYPQEMVFRTIGRIAFPIFAYQLAMGYVHTSNLKKYTLRLVGFSLISTVPYFYFSADLVFNPYSINIMYLLLAGIGALKLWDISKEAFSESKGFMDKFYIKGIACRMGFSVYIVLPQLIASKTVWNLSYSTYGLLMMIFFYWYRDKKSQMIMAYIALSIIMPYVDGVIAYSAFVNPAENLIEILRNVTSWNGGLFSLNGFFFQSRSVLGLAAILTLKDTNFYFVMPKWFAYWFYPAHISLLILLKANPLLLKWLI